MLVTLSHLDLVVAGGEVDFAEDLGALEAIHEFVNPRERVSVLDGYRVQEPVVDHHPTGAVLLGNEENRGGVR